MKLLKLTTLTYFCLGLLINSNSQAITVTDIDGNVYHTVKIGKQRWMQENLKVTRFRDGTVIKKVEPSSGWTTADQTYAPAWCYYQNDNRNNETYGKLYNWYVVTDTRNVCPVGWHVPSNKDFKILTDYLGGDNAAGGKMKDLTLWNMPNNDADNTSGFTALPGGNRYGYGDFSIQGILCYFWSSTNAGSSGAWGYKLVYDQPTFQAGTADKIDGFSVRCVGD